MHVRARELGEWEERAEGGKKEERRDGVGRGHKSGGSALDSAAEQG